MKGVQCDELFGGIALKIKHFHFHNNNGYFSVLFFQRAHSSFIKNRCELRIIKKNRLKALCMMQDHA